MDKMTPTLEKLGYKLTGKTNEYTIREYKNEKGITISFYAYQNWDGRIVNSVGKIHNKIEDELSYDEILAYAEVIKEIEKEKV